MEQQRLDLIARVEALQTEWSASLAQGAGGHSIHAHILFVALKTARYALEAFDREAGANNVVVCGTCGNDSWDGSNPEQDVCNQCGTPLTAQDARGS